MKEKTINNFNKGLITSLEAQSIPDGASSGSLNWLTKGDKIELRRGHKVLGTEDLTAGKVTGLHVTKKPDGTDLMYKTHGKKLEYLATDWVEVGSDQLGTPADGEDVSFDDYVTSAGNQLFLSSPNSSLYKILSANPGSIVDQYDSTKNFKGKIKIELNRMFLWGRVADKTGIYLSYIDAQSYTTATAEAIGVLGSLTYAGTLAFKGAGAKRTCFAVTFTDGTETFSDNYDGTLTGSAGGTGTINYATGAYSVTFNAVASGAVTSTYQWEDATANGIADFTKSATRTAGQGAIFRQDDGGGDAQALHSYADIQYCLHQFKAWRLDIGQTDTTATNRIFRDNVGVPNWRAAVATGEGIYYIDDSDVNDPKFRVLTFDNSSTEVIPVNKSNNLDLSDYRFDAGACIEWNDYVLFACRHKDSEANNRLFAYHKIWKTWDILDYYVSCFAIYNGALVAGDSLSNNIYELFSGFDDNESLIGNYWISNLTDLDIKRLKKVKRFPIQGEIQKDQVFKVYFDFDNSGFVEVGEISGDASYVDAGQAVNIGSETIGKKEVGGGSGDEVAYNYYTEIKVNTDKFEKIKVKFEATQIGYVSISEYSFKDYRLKQAKLPKKYRN